MRHQQWIPLLPGFSPSRLVDPRQQHRTQDFTAAGEAGQRPESLSSSVGPAQEKYTIVNVIADAAAGRFGLAASAFPPLGRLTEVQEEEIVLVHSFLNSQPQIDALPSGRADYEDHVPKELHWIDRPRIDKLTAAGRLGRKSDRRQHMVPVSPRTGRAVPERPGNCSYSALSRGKKGSKAVALTTSAKPVGILKTVRKTEQNMAGDTGLSTNPRPSPAVEQEARGLGFMPSGDTAAAVSGAGGAGGAPLALSSLPPSSRRAARTPEVDDEVFVEDLSEPQSYNWSGDNKEGCGPSEHETANGGGLSSRGEAQESGLAPGDGADDFSCPAEEDKRTVVGDSTSGGAPRRADQQASSFERGCRDVQGPAASARQGERQAWEGKSNSSNSSGGNSRGVDAAGVKQTGRGYGRGRTDDPRGENGSSRTSRAKGNNEKASKVTAPRATSTMTSCNGDSSRRSQIKTNVGVGGGQALDTGAEASVSAGAAALPNPKQLQRGGSEGSLKNTPAVLSTRTATPINLVQEKTRLPQASVGKAAAKYSKSPSTDFPGPGWGPDGFRRNDVGSGGQHQVRPESMPAAEDEACGKGQDGWGSKLSEPSTYSGVDGGGGSLQQLAQTPNPQQRRLPSPRTLQEVTQVLVLHYYKKLKRRLGWGVADKRHHTQYL